MRPGGRILIAGVSTRAIARSALDAGYDFLTLDYFGDYDQRAWCENHALRRDYGQAYGAAELYRAGQGLAYDAFAYTANLENAPGVVAQFASRLVTGGERPVKLWGNRPETLARVRDWADLYGFLRSEGERVPVTLPPGSVPTGAAPVRWLRKPVHTGGGHQIAFWKGDSPPAKGQFLQEYVAGTPCSVCFVANGREAVVLGSTEQWIGREDFGARAFWYCGNVFPLEPEGVSPTALEARLLAIARALTREYGLVGLNGLDFILQGEHAIPLEVNPRYTASMELIERATGLSMFDWHVRSIRDGELPAAAGGVKGQPYQAKAILYAERACRAPDTTGWPARDIADVPFPGDVFEPGDPVCTIMAAGPDAGACYRSLVARAGELKGELYA